MEPALLWCYGLTAKIITHGGILELTQEFDTVGTTKIQIEQWLERLENTFLHNGCVGGNLCEVLKQEEACGVYFGKNFHVQSVLIDSFQHFFIGTLRNSREWIVKRILPPNCPNYQSIYIYYLAMFRRFRACEILLCNGYPLDGFALLRGLKDLAIALSGIAHNLTTIAKIFAAEGVTDRDFKQAPKERKKEDQRVYGMIIGKKSGLPKEIKDELSEWQDMFHQEVHGSRFSQSIDLSSWYGGQGEPSIGATFPKPRDIAWANYMKRAVEVGWLVLRLLPYLQPVVNAFGEDWQREYGILDDSFRFVEKELSKDSGIKAFGKFVDAKFLIRWRFQLL